MRQFFFFNFGRLALQRGRNLAALLTLPLAGLLAHPAAAQTNNALDFSGANPNSVNIPTTTAFDLTTSLTIEAWIKPVGSGVATQNVICKSSFTQNTGYIFPRTDDNWNTLRFWMFRGGGWGQYNVAYTANIGTWHHVAATYNGTTVVMYVDGVVTPFTTSGNIVAGAIATNTNPLTLGNQPGYNEYYRGGLEDARVYNTVLTQAQIQADMFSTASALPGNQVLFYNFNQGTAGSNNAGVTALTDQSGNGRTGTLNGFALSGTASNWVRSFPTITGIAPASGAPGTVATITGTNLTDATSFRFNTTAVSPFTTPGSDLTATVTVPGAATTGPVQAASATLAAYQGPAFTVTADLVVSTTQAIPAGTYNSITVQNGGVGTLASGVVVNGFVLVQNGGSLSDGCNFISGSGTFTLSAGGTLVLCRPRGILAVGDPQGNVGTVRMTGGRSFSNDANYIYNGSDATGSGLPSQVRNLSITVPGDVALSQPTSVVQALTLSSTANLVLGGNALTLLSSASGTALVVNSGTGVVNGPVTVQRSIDPSLNAGLGYRHFSAPVSNSTVADLATAGFSPEVSQASVYNASATPGSTTPFPTVFAYDQSRVTLTNNYVPFDRGFAVPAAQTAPLVVGRGYAVNLPATALVDFVGTLTTGDQSPLVLSRVASNADAGWQLLGNPYPSPLDYSLVAAGDRANLDAAIYVFGSTSQYAGTYRSYVNGVGGNPVLPVAQGFFVRVSAGQTSASLTFRNSQRLTTPNPTAFQRPATDPRPLVQLDLRGATGPADALYAYAEVGATTAFDPQYDAHKLPNSTGLNLASVASTGESLSIDGRPVFVAGTVLPLTVGVPAAGSYSLTAATLANLPAGLEAFLTDATTGQTVNLSRQPSYSFTVTPAQAVALMTSRFTLRFAAGPLATVPTLTAAQVGLYPNPAHARFVVLLPGVAGASAVQAELLNALGQVVHRQSAALPVGGTTLTVETAGLAAGVYTLRLRAGAATLAKRVVLQ